MLFGLLPLRLIPKAPNINFMGHRKIAVIFSILVTIAAFFGLGFKGLNLGIDFAGGILMEISVNKTDARIVHQIREEVAKHYHSNHIQEYQTIGNEKANIMIRIQPKIVSDYEKDINNLRNIVNSVFITQSHDTINETTHGDKSESNPTNNIATPNQEKHSFKVERVDYVGPKVGNDFIKSAVYAMLAALIMMMIYVWFRFDWHFGIGVIISLLHDAIATMGFYVFSGCEFDLTSIAALLTVIGYSINDSVVIYDRIRENIAKYHQNKKQDKEIKEIINLSLNETLSRTTMTVATTLLVCGVLAIFGGQALNGFSLAILFGIAFGTYSSIYVSTLVLLPLARYSRISSSSTAN